VKRLPADTLVKAGETPACRHFSEGRWNAKRKTPPKSALKLGAAGRTMKW